MTIDITERRRIERALAHQREWFRVTLASIGDGVITADRDARVSFMNAVAEELTGWSAAEAAGRPLDRCVSHRGRRRRSGLRSLWRGDAHPRGGGVGQPHLPGGPRRQQALHRRQRCPHHRRRPAGDRRGAGLPRRQAERRTPGAGTAGRGRGARAAAGERAGRPRRGRTGHPAEGRLRGHPVARAAHPAQRHPGLGADPAAQGRATPRPWRAGWRSSSATPRLQAQLISDLLDISRIVSGKLRLELELVDLAAVIDAAVETVRPAAEAKGVRIERVIEPGAPPLPGDAARLQQIVWNLLANAIKFTPERGRRPVRLRARTLARGDHRRATAASASTPSSSPPVRSLPAGRQPPPPVASAGWGWGWPSSSSWSSCTRGGGGPERRRGSGRHLRRAPAAGPVARGAPRSAAAGGAVPRSAPAAGRPRRACACSGGGR